MFGLFTVNVKVTYKGKVICVLYRKHFIFQKSAEKFADEIEEVQLGVKADLSLDKTRLKGLITISDRYQEDYYFKKVSCGIEVATCLET